MTRAICLISVAGLLWPVAAFAAACPWEVPEVARGQHLMVKVQAAYRIDGSVQSVILAHEMEPQVANPAFKEMAQAALKTVKHCPLQDMPQKDYDKWHYMEFNFDSDEAADSGT